MPGLRPFLPAILPSCPSALPRSIYDPILEPSVSPCTPRTPRRAGHRSLVELAPGGARGVPAPRLPALAGDGAQPGPHAVAHPAREARGSGDRSGVSCAVRRGSGGARRCARRTQHVVVAPLPATQRPVHRVLLGRVRAAPVAADLRRRPWRARGRSLQGSRRPRRPAHRRRVHVSAGLFPPAPVRGRLAGGKLREAELGRRADRTGADAGRQAVHHRGAARRSVGAGRRLAGSHGPREALPARHGSRRERALGPRAVGAALRRRPRNADAAGNHPRHRRRARVESARREPRRVPSQRRARRLRRAAAHPRSHRAGLVVRRRARRDSPDDDVHDAHARAGRTRRVSVSARRKTSGQRLGHARREPRPVPGAGRLRQRRRPAVQHDGARDPLRRLDQRGEPAARRGDARDVRADVARTSPKRSGRSRR